MLLLYDPITVIYIQYLLLFSFTHNTKTYSSYTDNPQSPIHSPPTSPHSLDSNMKMASPRLSFASPGQSSMSASALGGLEMDSSNKIKPPAHRTIHFEPKSPAIRSFLLEQVEMDPRDEGKE